MDMSAVPRPAYPLENVCSTIFANTLYTYSPTAFQSLELTSGATWKTLSMGVSTDGAVCVKTTPVNNTNAAALWIVGGKANETDYQGLQRYSFLDQTWESIQSIDPVAKDRLWHGAAYLNKSDSILMFAGTQDGTRQASSQTFTIKASKPYDVRAYEASAPPAIGPVIIPWTQSKALYVGGSESNTKVMVFSPSNSWEDTNATLAVPFYNCSRIQAISQNGNDASKTLYTFDMSVKPNSVNRTIIIDGDGNPVQNAVPIVAASFHASKNNSTASKITTTTTTTTKHDLEDLEDLEERDLVERDLEPRGNLTVANWPAYNDTLAPASVRSAYAIARDQSGMTVITGGNPNDVLCIFKARDNTWVNSTSIFAQKNMKEDGIGGIGPAPSSTVLPTTSSTASPDNPLADKTPGTPFPVKILGAVLGSVIGAALILIGILFYLRWKKKRVAFFDAGHQRRSSGLSDEKMDYANRGLPQMSSTRQFRHGPQESAGSFSSLAILLGRGHKRGGENGNGSQASESSGQFNRDYKAAIGKPTPIQEDDEGFRSFAMADEKAPVIGQRPSPKPRTTKTGRPSMRRSSGWNKYWSGGSALGMLGFGKRNTVADDERSDTSSISRYSGPSQFTQASAMPPPLNFGDRPTMQRVASGSPTVHNNGMFSFTRASTAQVLRPGSVSTLSSFDGVRDDAFSSGIPESVYEEFTQTRQSSNIFSDSNYPILETELPRLPQSVQQSSSSRGQQSVDMSWLNLGDQRRL